MKSILTFIIILFASLIYSGTSAQKKLAADKIVTPQDSGAYRKQQANKDFFNRIIQFSQLSWACLPYTDIGSDKKGYILSADISPQFFIGGERMRFAIALTPGYKVRIFRNNKSAGDSSLPVRTPSFMPGATLFIPIHLGTPDLYKNIHYVSLSFFHHSNGQDQPTFKAPGVFNYATGNFSTNYFELGYTYNWRKSFQNQKSNLQFDCLGSEYPLGYIDKLFKIGLEQHVWTATEQKGTYGETRINASFSFIKVNNWRWTVKRKQAKTRQQVGSCYLKEAYRLIAKLSMNIDKLENPYNNFDRRLNIEAGIYRRIAAGNTSVFAMAGYYGNDPYNIYYSKNYPFIRAGLALGFFVQTSKISQ